MLYRFDAITCHQILLLIGKRKTFSLGQAYNSPPRVLKVLFFHIEKGEQKKAIDKGLESLEKDNSLSHEQVMNETENRYPNLFK
ncbi:MAG: hypothetical protein B7C24_12270 [Bacteroidetes bacterium 4572_77]|nr:MAG: hypothetical protein B7C24_12270 [Bacteroidetes bacterium 4572_77]